VVTIRTLCTIFYQDRGSFVENKTKTFWLTFFWDTMYKSVLICLSCTCIVQMLNPGVGCPKYQEEMLKVFANDWVRQYEECNKVSHISLIVTCIAYCLAVC